MIDPNEFTVSIFNGEPKLEKYIGNKETVVIPEEFKRIGFGAFKDCKCIKEVVIPGSVNCIAARAFQGAVNLEKVTFSEGLETIEHEAFSGCENLKEAILPDSLKVMDYAAFMLCKKLEKITFGKKLKILAANVTNRCTGIQSLTIPATLQKVDEINGMAGLKTLIVESELKKNKKIYVIDCNELIDIRFPEGTDPARIYVVACSKAKQVFIGDKPYEIYYKKLVGTLIPPAKKASAAPDTSIPVEFHYDEKLESFVCEYKGLQFAADNEPDEQACNTVRVLAENYIANLNKIVKFMLPDLKEIYGKVTAKTAITKLGKPTIRFENGTVTYLEQTFDDEHIFEFEFMDDEFEDLDNFVIDG